MIDGGVVSSAADLSVCQQIRFRVFCRERTIFQEAEYRDEIEQDDFDEIATHLAVARRGGAVLGTARLVPHSSRGFPLERYSSARIPADTAPTTVEVSRLAVPRSLGGHRRRLSGEVGLQLFRIIYSAARRDGRTHLVAAMERPLVRILKSFSIPLREIGPVVDFGGLVQPYMISIAEFDAVDSEAAQFFRSGVPAASPERTERPSA